MNHNGYAATQFCMILYILRNLFIGALGKSFKKCRFKMDYLLGNIKRLFQIHLVKSFNFKQWALTHAIDNANKSREDERNLLISLSN